jgi:hypothetical protein
MGDRLYSERMSGRWRDLDRLLRHSHTSMIQGDIARESRGPVLMNFAAWMDDSAVDFAFAAFALLPPCEVEWSGEEPNFISPFASSNCMW